MRPTASAVIIVPMVKQPTSMHDPAVYRVCVMGRVPLDWSARLMGMNITSSASAQRDERTILVGRLPDQAALSGILNTLYEKQYPVLSVECLETG